MYKKHAIFIVVKSNFYLIKHKEKYENVIFKFVLIFYP